MINTIIFDLGGTLIDYTGEHHSWPELETPGLTAAYDYLASENYPLPPFPQFRDTGFAQLPLRWRAATRGEQNLTLPSLIADILTTLNTPLPPASALTIAGARYEVALCQHARILAGTAEALTTLKEAGYKIGLISNTMFNGHAHIADMKRFNIDHYFDTMLFSGDENKWKPTAAPFQHVLELLEAAAETAVYIGDSPADDILGAQNAGLYTVHMNSHNRFDPIDFTPHATITDLRQLPPIIAQLTTK